MTRSGSHERIIETDGETRRGYPVNSKEKVEWLKAFYVEIKVYATQLVENQVSDDVRALYLYGSKPDEQLGDTDHTNADRTLSVTEVGFEEIWVVLGDERVRSLCVPKLELPLRTGVQFGASSIGCDPFLLHSQITEPSLVDDPWNDLWRVHW